MSGVRVKVYRVEGVALFSPDKTRKWQPFIIDVRALKPAEAIEKVYSDMGSRHKLKRGHIKIINVKEINPEESKYKYIRSLEKFTGWSIE
ncbi:MAG: 50S ribosomal protein L18Ae [Sulfolobales archaeon]|nr:50S ribosomal protein L18Ae [Sulfolobales archaeon]MCX8186323.1 50S ribosomal protein L18Ae [Sulfolobales archaeon]MDW7968941.1 50S ribosomal protein L18Ae [Sulfolobales archaeon]